ncbi:MAG: respiratory nitrate reductase subunit gamma [Thermoleophilia bacterium]|nr:respiratory nitrate reductase subunit gamma [Thermoleophilia bacterium]
MSGLTIVFSLFFYIAFNIFLVGILLKLWKYAATPAPLKIPQTPAPKTAAGVGFRMFQEVALFKSLFRGNKLVWLGGYIFHLGLLLVFIKHFRFLLPSTPLLLDNFVKYDLYTGFILLGALAFLFILRLAIDRHFFISVINDYLLLGLLMAIASTGLLSRFWPGGGVKANIPEIKAFVGGLFSFHPGPVPLNALFLIHFSLVMILLMYFPFSKMMHAFGVFFSPTRNQIDNSRQKRWGPWTVRTPGRPQPEEPVYAQPSFAVSDED